MPLPDFVNGYRLAERVRIDPGELAGTVAFSGHNETEQKKLKAVNHPANSGGLL